MCAHFIRDKIKHILEINERIFPSEYFIRPWPNEKPQSKPLLRIETVVADEVAENVSRS